MKKIVLSLLLTLALSAKPFLKQTDKQLHIAATSLVSASITSIALNKGYSKKQAIIYGISSGILIGLTKEFYDEIDYGGFSKADLGADLIGSVLGTIFTINIKF